MSKELIFIVSITCYYSWQLIYVILCIACLLKPGSYKETLTICWTCRCATHQTAASMLGKWWTADNDPHLIQYALYIIHTVRGSDLALVHPQMWQTTGDMVVTECNTLCPTLSSGSVWQIGKQKISECKWHFYDQGIGSQFPVHFGMSKNTSPRV